MSYRPKHKTNLHKLMDSNYYHRIEMELKYELRVY